MPECSKCLAPVRLLTCLCFRPDLRHIQNHSKYRHIGHSTHGKQACSRCSHPVLLADSSVVPQFAMLAFEDMVKLARPGAVTECLSEEAITELVFALARTNQPKHLIRVLETLVEDRRPLPIQTLVPINVDGLSFVTSWVPAALENARTLQEVEGASIALSSATLISGTVVCLLAGWYCVTAQLHRLKEAAI